MKKQPSHPSPIPADLRLMLSLRRLLTAPTLSPLSSTLRTMATAPTTNQFPPPDAARGATADLCDVHYPDSVDVVVGAPKVQIAAPVFR